MRYNFNNPVLTLEGTPMKEGFLDSDKTPIEREVTIGRVIAAQLASSNDPDPLKMMSLAMKLYSSTTPVELDDSDKKKLESFIEENKQLVNLVRAQALQILSNPIKEN